MNKLFFIGISIFSQIACSDNEISKEIVYQSFAPIDEAFSVICKLFLFETSAARRNGSFLSYNNDEDNRFLTFYIRRKDLDKPSDTLRVSIVREGQQLKDVFEIAKNSKRDLNLDQYNLTAIFRQKPEPLKVIYADFKEGSNRNLALQTTVKSNDEFLFFLERGEYKVTDQIPKFNDDDKSCLCGCQ